MSITSLRAACAIALLGCVASESAGAQSLASRMSAAPDGLVQFSFAARAGVCGNGRSYISTGGNNYIGSFSGSSDEMSRRDPCAPGPVRVVLTRADRSILSVETYVGPPAVMQGATDLGTVRAAEAAEYLVSLAGTLDGRPGRDALMPAMLADSADVTAGLLGIARDQTRPREIRRSAISWLARDDGAGQAAPSERVTSALVAIAKDAVDNQSVRSQAVSVLARIDRGAGVPALMDLSRATGDLWLAQQAMASLTRSGDPRARQFLRTIVQRTDLSDDMIASGIRGIGREYATSRDAEFLRGLYPKLAGDKSKESVLMSVAEIGGADNVKWLLSLARNESEPAKLRRRAIQSASKAGASSADLVGLYDGLTDREMKDALVSVYVESGDKASTDKLLSIAKTEQDPTLRRRIIARLSRSEDPRIRQMLQDIIER